MSNLEETWASIQTYVQDYKQLDLPDSPERRQAVLRITRGFRKIQEDLDVFLKNAPPGDLRRDIALDLQEIIRRART